MAFEIAGLDITFEAAADLSAKQFYIMELDTAGKVNVANATTDVPIGYLQNKPKSGEPAIVRVSGVSKASADGVVTVGTHQFVGTSADGQTVAKTADADHVIGVPLETSAAAGDLIAVLLRPMQRAS